MSVRMGRMGARRDTVAVDGPIHLDQRGGTIERRRRSINVVPVGGAAPIIASEVPVAPPSSPSFFWRHLRPAWLHEEYRATDALTRTIKAARKLEPHQYNRYTLTFTNQRRESAYEEQMAQLNQRVTQVVYVTTFFLVGLLCAFEVAQRYSDALKQDLTFYYGANLILLTGVVAFNLSRRIRAQYTNMLTLSAVVLLCSMETATVLVSLYHDGESVQGSQWQAAHHPYRGTLTLLMAFTAGAFAKLRFIYAVAAVVLCGSQNVLLLWLFPHDISTSVVLLYCSSIQMAATIAFLFNAYTGEYSQRASFLRVLAVHSENQSLTAEVKALKRASTIDPKAAIVAPIETVTDMLARIMNDETLPAGVVSRLESVVDILTRHPTLFKPDLEDQINHGQLQVDRDTKSWLLSEVTPRPTHRRNLSATFGERAAAASFRAAAPTSHPSALTSSISRGSLRRASHTSSPPPRAAHTLPPSPPPPSRSSDHQRKLDSLLAQHTQWNFDVFALRDLTGNTPLASMFITCLEAHALLSELNLDVDMVRRFIARIEKGYRSDIPYHTSMHAADVLHAVNHLMSSKEIVERLSPLEKFSLLLAASIHDYGHPGVNNSFLVKTRHALAVLYNDASPLENHHVAEAYAILGQPEYDLLSHLPRADRDASRRLVIDLVLATDIARHFSLVAQLSSRLSVGNLDLDNPSDLSLALQMLVKCADVSNPSKALEIYRPWARLVMDEFYLQGDKERAMGLEVSPYMDREKKKEAKCQSDFISFICLPTFKAVEQLVKRDDLVEQSNRNMQYWREIEAAEAVSKSGVEDKKEKKKEEEEEEEEEEEMNSANESAEEEKKDGDGESGQESDDAN